LLVDRCRQASDQRVSAATGLLAGSPTSPGAAESAPKFTPPPLPTQSLGGTSVTVTSFRIVGNTLLSAGQIAPSLASFLNRPLGLTELQNAAAAVAAAYRKAGWVVHVYLQITGGALTIQIAP
jgi:hemolysin activation/secretion protein